MGKLTTVLIAASLILVAVLISTINNETNKEQRSMEKVALEMEAARLEKGYFIADKQFKTMLSEDLQAYIMTTNDFQPDGNSLMLVAGGGFLTYGYCADCSDGTWYPEGLPNKAISASEFSIISLEKMIQAAAYQYEMFDSYQGATSGFIKQYITQFKIFNTFAKLEILENGNSITLQSTMRNKNIQYRIRLKNGEAVERQCSDNSDFCKDDIWEPR